MALTATPTTRGGRGAGNGGTAGVGDGRRRGADGGASLWLLLLLLLLVVGGVRAMGERPVWGTEDDEVLMVVPLYGSYCYSYYSWWEGCGQWGNGRCGGRKTTRC